MQNRLLSVIVPLYNGGRYIEKLIDSIALYNDGFFSYEIILVNDGSTDNTNEICHSLIKDHPYILYLEKQNGGIASARNTGLEHATGLFVTFADQDDYVVEGYKEYIDYCVSNDLDMLLTSPYVSYEDKGTVTKRQLTDQIIDNKDIIMKTGGQLIHKYYLSDESVPKIFSTVWNGIYKRSIICDHNIRFKVFLDYEDDLVFNVEYLLIANKIGLSSDGYYCWNYRDSSESHRKKYIQELVIKGKSWVSWISSVMNRMNIDPDRKDDYIQNVLIPRGIIVCFNNACWHEEVGFIKKILEIKEAISSEGWNIASVELNSIKEMSPSNRFILKLLKSNHVGFAYFLNRAVLKHRYH